MSHLQTAENRRGEVFFRSFHPGYVDSHLAFVERLIRFRQDPFAHLAFDGVPMSPYLEIGAELCVNGMILENRLGLRGVAADLSRDSLRTAESYREKLGMDRLPFRVCCDAYRLPFRRNTFPFVFGWGTFHHFPDPTPIFAEARRVLHPDGVFFFDEEPIRRRLGLNLYNTGTAPHDLTRAESVLFRLGLLPYVAVLGGKDEVEKGILEGTFGVGELRGHLSVFDEVKLRFNPQLTGGIASEGAVFRALFRSIWDAEKAARAATKWFGGAASGRCRKYERGMILAEGVDGDTGALDGLATILLKRAPVHDRIGIELRGANGREPALAINGEAPVGWTREEGAGADVWTGELPENAKHCDVVSAAIRGVNGAKLDKIWFQSTAQPGSYFEYAPLPDPPRDVDAGRMLACPDCLSVDARCVPDRCNRPCLQASAAVSIHGGRAAIERGNGHEAISSCPFGHIDRSPLEPVERGYRCTACGRLFETVDGVLTLLPQEVENELYGA